jgi:uncharacterized protein YjiS (DUF1127 family)
MRESAIQVESLTMSAARMLATGMHHVWRACQVASWRLARQRTRRALAGLDDRMLRDVGITREQAIREAEKPMWMA